MIDDCRLSICGIAPACAGTADRSLCLFVIKLPARHLPAMPLFPMTWFCRFVPVGIMNKMDVFNARQAGRGALLNALSLFVDLLKRGRRDRMPSINNHQSEG